MKYKSELIRDILETRGHEKSSLHYESECLESWIEEAKGAYPKLCDYESEWLNYIKENPIGDFPYETVTNVTKATINNVVPYAYKSAILKGQTLVNLLTKTSISVSANTSATENLNITYKLPAKQYIMFYNVVGANTSPNDSNSRHTPRINLEDGTSLYQGFEGFNTTTGRKYWIFTASSNIVDVYYWVQNISTDVVVNNFMLLEYQQGMENWDNPYFEGMQSVKMPVLTTSNEDGTKTNILTVNEEVELRGIGEVQDTLDLMTGEMTERISEVVLNGSEDETYNTLAPSFNGSSNTVIEFIPSENLVVSLENDYTNAFLSNYNYKQQFDIDWITNSSNVWGIYLGVTDNKTTVRIIVDDGTTDAEVRQHLQENPLRIVCKLASPTIKTVDLSVVNQDGNTTHLRPIEGTMNISTSSETIKPLFSGEIPVEAITQNLASFIEGE